MHPELAYMFKHALTHDVAYESVLVQRRKQLHRTIGIAIEELYADRLAEHYETLAHHFERGEDWERALRYHEHAAEKAARRATRTTRSSTHCRAALAIADRTGSGASPKRRRHVERMLARAALLVSSFRESADAFRRASTQATSPADGASDLAFAGYAYVWAHAYDDAERATTQALEQARANGAGGAEAVAIGTQGFLAGINGDVQTFERRCVESLAIASRANDDHALALGLVLLAEAAEWRGDYRLARERCEQALTAGRKARMADVVVIAHWFHGKATCCVGDYGRAIADMQESLELCDRIGDRACKTRLLNTLGWCLAEVGAHARAREYNRRAAAIASDIGDPEIVANADINLAANALALGDVDLAAATLEPFRVTLASPGDPWMRWRYGIHVLDGLGNVALARRDPESALRHADEALAGARRHGAQKLEARALALRGRALLEIDRRDDAQTALREAITIGERIGYPPVRWRALRLLAEAARRDGRRDDAAAHTAHAQQIVDALLASLPDAELRALLAASARPAI